MVTEKRYLDNILHEVDPVIMLDDDQRRVVLTDEDYCLVIAGAGAGKTTTVAAKVKYPVLHPTYDGMHYAETMTNAKLKKLQVYLMEQSS